METSDNFLSNSERGIMSLQFFLIVKILYGIAVQYQNPWDVIPSF